MSEQRRFYPIIGGEERKVARFFTIKQPYNGEEVAEVGRCGEKEVEDAVTAAAKAFEITKRLSKYDKESILDKLCCLIQDAHFELSNILVEEVGKTITEARGEVNRAINTFKLSRELAVREGGRTVPFDAASNGQGKWGLYKRVPVGPVVAITPFNFPLNLAAHKLGPAVAAGNTVILKPSPMTSMSGIKLGALLIEAGYPKEAVSVVPGTGSEVGTPLVIDDRVKVVTFTGSVPVGKKLAKLAGFKKRAMELGSNSGVLVMPDGDIDRAVDRITLGAFALAGQVCISVQRVYIHEAVYDEMRARLIDAARSLVVGDPFLEETNMGSMITPAATERVDEWIKETTDAGGDILLGGEHDHTLYMPTIIENPPEDSKLIKDETFGPVYVLKKVKSAAEGLEKLNDSRYGLQAGIFTRDIHLAYRAFEELDVGGVFINEIPTFRVDLMPYGGMKDSGLGCEGPEFAYEHMTKIKLLGVHQES